MLTAGVGDGGGVISRMVRLRLNVARIDCCIFCRAFDPMWWRLVAVSSGAGGGIFGSGRIGGGAVAISSLWFGPGACGCVAGPCVWTGIFPGALMVGGRIAPTGVWAGLSVELMRLNPGYVKILGV